MISEGYIHLFDGEMMNEQRLSGCQLKYLHTRHVGS